MNPHGYAIVLIVAMTSTLAFGYLVGNGHHIKITRAHRAHTPCAMAISPMAMPLLRGFYSLKFNLLLLTNFFVPF